MKISEVYDKELWDSFIVAQPYYSFYQSWNFGEFDKGIGNKIWRLGLFDREEKLKGAALLTKIRAKLRKFLFISHGPLFETSDLKEKKLFLSTFIENLKFIAKKEKIDFIRIAPGFLNSLENQELFKELNFISSPMPIFTERSWYLDITPSEKELMEKMRKTTRYCIRKSWRDGVLITKENSREHLKYFYSLYRDSAQRNNFIPYSYQYLKKEIENFSPDNQISIFIGWYKNEPLAGAIVVFYGSTAFYHHGATSIKHSKIPAGYGLQWEIIKTAKQRGLEFYNFLAVAPKNTVHHPFSGVTLFKTGFGGFPVEYLHAQDIPLTSKYWLRYIFETIRRKLRRL